MITISKNFEAREKLSSRRVSTLLSVVHRAKLRVFVKRRDRDNMEKMSQAIIGLHAEFLTRSIDEYDDSRLSFLHVSDNFPSF